MFVQHGSVPLRTQGQVSVTWTMMDPEGLNKPCSAFLHASEHAELCSSLSTVLLVHQTARAGTDTNMRAKHVHHTLSSTAIQRSTKALLMLLHGTDFFFTL